MPALYRRLLLPGASDGVQPRRAFRAAHPLPLLRSVLAAVASAHHPARGRHRYSRIPGGQRVLPGRHARLCAPGPGRLPADRAAGGGLWPSDHLQPVGPSCPCLHGPHGDTEPLAGPGLRAGTLFRALRGRPRACHRHPPAGPRRRGRLPDHPDGRPGAPPGRDRHSGRCLDIHARVRPLRHPPPGGLRAGLRPPDRADRAAAETGVPGQRAQLPQRLHRPPDRRLKEHGGVLPRYRRGGLRPAGFALLLPR